MSKRDKLFEKLTAKPPPKGFKWDDLITLTTHYGFVATCSGGSHHRFQHPSGLTFIMSKTHPSGILKPYQVQAACEAIAKVKDLST